MESMEHNDHGVVALAPCAKTVQQELLLAEEEVRRLEKAAARCRQLEVENKHLAQRLQNTRRGRRERERILQAGIEQRSAELARLRTKLRHLGHEEATPPPDESADKDRLFSHLESPEPEVSATSEEVESCKGPVESVEPPESVTSQAPMLPEETLSKVPAVAPTPALLGDCLQSALAALRRERPPVALGERAMTPVGGTDGRSSCLREGAPSEWPSLGLLSDLLLAGAELQAVAEVCGGRTPGAGVAELAQVLTARVHDRAIEAALSTQIADQHRFLREKEKVRERHIAVQEAMGGILKDLVVEELKKRELLEQQSDLIGEVEVAFTHEVVAQQRLAGKEKGKEKFGTLSNVNEFLAMVRMTHSEVEDCLPDPRLALYRELERSVANLRLESEDLRTTVAAMQVAATSQALADTPLRSLERQAEKALHRVAGRASEGLASLGPWASWASATESMLLESVVAGWRPLAAAKVLPADAQASHLAAPLAALLHAGGGVEGVGECPMAALVPKAITTSGKR